MSYLVFARKYRPQTFSEVVKQEHVTDTLSNAISADRVAHAILFAGPRGTGKTTVARIMAKAMNCEKGPISNPCNICRSCKEITSSSAVDVFEIDGASNNSVDQIRELRDNIKYMPAYSKYKIYIIDEVHMLSVAAFNALLKTLEEPPDHIMFMFATTEPRKIPITILSRCQRHDLKRIDIESLCKHMEMICKKENVKLPLESLDIISREAGGSMRDALSLLDQIVSSFEGEINHNHVLKLLGVVDRKALFQISEAVLKSDMVALLDIVDEIYNGGYDILKFYTDLVAHFRNMLVVKMVKMGDSITGLVNLPDHEIDIINKQVKEVSINFLRQIFESIFNEGEKIRFSSDPKIALEMLFVKTIEIQHALPIDELIEKLDHLRKGVYSPCEEKIIDAEISKESRGEKPYHKSDYTGDNNDLSMISHLSHQQSPEKESDGNTSVKPADDYDETWTRIIKEIEKESPALSANLSNSKIKSIIDGKLEIQLGGNDFSHQIIRRKKNEAFIKKICSDFLGKEVDILFNIDSKHKDKKPNINAKNQGDSLKNQALNDPIVMDAIEIFKGNIVDVKIIREDL